MDHPSRPKVLVVDDHQANLQALTVVIETLPVQVVAVESGEAALVALQSDVFALVLLDVMMPGLDGIATLTRMRELPNGEETPVIVMTAAGPEQPLVRRAYELNAADYISKPIDTEVLLPKVRVFVTLWRQKQELAAQAERLLAKDRHIGILAHDLRTPLATVLMAAARVQSSPDQAKELGRRIVRAATRMANLADDVLEFARASNSQFPLQLREIDLGSLCRELIEEFAATHPTVTFVHEPAGEVMGHWDEKRLQQAVSNLVGNAVKYGDGWVRLELRSQEADVELIVENRGAPIQVERLERLFEPFERGTERHDGVGLGLYIVKEIARAHGGDVRAGSSQLGTSFSMQLPRRRENKLALRSPRDPRDVPTIRVQVPSELIAQSEGTSTPC